MSTENQKETLGFQAEVKQVLKLVINSLYSNKEIFLRELVSNGADACDKLRFEAISDDALYEGESDLGIRVAFDEEAKTLTITDSGIGMSRQEVTDNIGTIAKSGTRQFFENMTGDQKKDANLIGQFGVGFYSAFIVADKVTVETRRAGVGHEHGVRWESKGLGEYSIETIDKASRGTEITLHMKEGEEELLNSWKLKGIIHKYSEHITLPIEMLKDEPPAGEDDDEKKDETIVDDVKAPEWEQVNKATALWTKPRNEVEEEEYKEFYHHVGHDWQDPLPWVHAKVEGSLEYTQLLYIPGKAPFDLYERDRSHGVKLYVQRVFILEDTEKLMPNYLRFVRGVIDSSDLPLNVSREILQSSKVVDKISKGSVKKVLGMLEGLAKKEPEKYMTFWKEFGNTMKEGVIEDTGNKDRIAKLLRFSTSLSDNEEQDVALEDYVSRMREGQKAIYYITAESFNAARNSPHLEVFRKKSIEVILLHDRVDEWVTSHLTEFDGKPLHSIMKGDLDLGDLEDKEEKKELEKDEKEFKGLIERITETLKEDIKEVRVTHRLTDSPACLVSDEQDMGANMERILQSMGQEAPTNKRIMEVNPRHPLVTKMDSEQDEDRFADWTRIIYEQSILAEGGHLDDPAAFTKRLNGLLQELSQ